MISQMKRGRSKNLESQPHPDFVPDDDACVESALQHSRRGNVGPARFALKSAKFRGRASGIRDRRGSAHFFVASVCNWRFSAFPFAVSKWTRATAPLGSTTFRFLT